MATFLRDKKVLEADVIAVQEPWRNEFNATTHQPASRTHQLLYPKGQARVALFVNKRIDPSKWIHTIVNKDYQVLQIHYERGGPPRMLAIHNIYNEPEKTTLSARIKFLKLPAQIKPDSAQNLFNYN
ncbi:hypothetical protein BGW36DRAFT_428380 [Talaromyces proteolyticus]|uniref:Endonuclease/exonuclease/phosphatase domain-containing protein n=1 Tax=Talaromyces proteolyticus TaxID=1131652 RepID=A0AAD4PXG3_9EURO|nr:uncharacterized protein BGW36DRAFT_428380 [Talaromyces proteolyticus]KAH8696364.1 hypothetical protein BGW36DRAFT_428380 [Talaromyces proteolyticus]